MLCCDRISDISEGIDINKAVHQKSDILRYLHFTDKRFKFQPNFCDGCHDVLMMSINLNDIAIRNIRGVNYCRVINGISKSEAVNLLQNADLTEEKGVL